MSYRYKILFSIDLLNDYYLNQQSPDFTIYPSAQTAQLLKNHQMIFRFLRHQAFVLCKVHTDGPEADQPLVPLDSAARLIFYIDLVRPIMYNYTNLDLDALRSRRFYFTNLHQNVADDRIYLSDPIVEYDADEPYSAGSFVMEGDDLYEALLPQLDEAHDPSEEEFWTNRGPLQYAAPADMIRLVRPVEYFQLTTPDTDFAIRLFRYNSLTDDFDDELTLAHPTFSADEDVSTVQVNLTGVSPGKYRLAINNDEFDIYLDGEAVYANCFGVIELFNHFPGGTASAFLTADGRVKDGAGTGENAWLHLYVRFANRLAFWKYVSTAEAITGIDDTSNTYSFASVPLPPPPVPANATGIFLSDRPIGLTERPSEFDIVLSRTLSGDPPRAPNPDPYATGMLTRLESNYYCTIFLNY